MTERTYSTQQIAAALGVDERSVRRRAEREGWQPCGKQGKANLYRIQDLPPATRAHLLLKEQRDQRAAALPAGHGPVNAVDSLDYDPDSLWAYYERRTFAAKDEADARLKLLLAVEELVEHGLALTEARAQVATQSGVSERTLARYAKAVEGYAACDRLPVLLPGYAGRQAHAPMDIEAWDFFRADYLRDDHPTLSSCYQRLKGMAKKKGWNIPSEATLARRVKREIPRQVLILTRHGEKALEQALPAQERDKTPLKALEWINGDGYKHNVFVKFPDGSIERPKTWFWQDVYSGMILGWRTDLTENTDMIRLACLDVFEKYGLPDNHVLIDNTRAAANKWMTGGIANRFRFKVKPADPVGLLPGLGLKVHWATPGWGQSKPIERAFGVGGVGEYVDKHPLCSGAWCGNNPQAKPESYGSRAVDFTVFQQALSEGIATWNAISGRRTEVCRGQLSYEQAFFESYKSHAVRRLSESQRRMFLLCAEKIRVAADGTFKMQAGKGFGVGQNRYGGEKIFAYAGQKIVVRFDPQNLHGQVYCYTLAGLEIGVAECIQAVGFGDSSKAREHQRARRQVVKHTKEIHKAQQRMSALEVGEMLLAHAEPPPAPEPPQVIKPLFGVAKQTVNGDFLDDEDDNPDPNDLYRLSREMLEYQRKTRL
jgi:AraC-like DNA-binding protein